MQIVVGDWAAREVARDQPTKLAAFEGLYETAEGAPVHVGGLVRRRARSATAIALPRLLSLLAFHDPGARSRGPRRGARMTSARRSMSSGSPSRQWSASASCSPAILLRSTSSSGCDGGDCPARTWFYRAVVAAGPLSVVALIAGWVTTEVGRQPWVVYGHMRTEQAVTGASGIPVGYAIADPRLRRAPRRRGLDSAPARPRTGGGSAAAGGVAPLVSGAARPKAEKRR